MLRFYFEQLAVNRFVILYHQLPPGTDRASHWDLMLEYDGVLLTWELLTEFTESHSWTPCRRLSDHRLAYLDYQGLVSNDRGTVERCEQGALRWESMDDEQMHVRLEGERFTGSLHLKLDEGSWWYLYRR